MPAIEPASYFGEVFAPQLRLAFDVRRRVEKLQLGPGRSIRSLALDPARCPWIAGLEVSDGIVDEIRGRWERWALQAWIVASAGFGPLSPARTETRSLPAFSARRSSTSPPKTLGHSENARFEVITVDDTRCLDDSKLKSSSPPSRSKGTKPSSSKAIGATMTARSVMATARPRRPRARGEFIGPPTPAAFTCRCRC